MKRWIALAGRLYPRQWRERYGAEFDALLEDARPGWRQFADVVRGAIQMQMKSPSMYWKMAGAVAIAGAIVALAVSFAVPRQYVSTAVLQMRLAQHDPGHEAASRLGEMQQEILSRGSVTELIIRPALNLYREERARTPLEDVVKQMRREIRIQALSAREGVFAISFAYRDERKAQAVVRELVSKFMEQNVAVHRQRERMWQAVWHESPPAGGNIEVLDAPSLPGSAVAPNRPLFLILGLGAGALVGLAAGFALRRPRWVLPVAGCAAAGCVLALGASSFFPKRYVSTVVMRFTPPEAPARVTGEVTAKSLAERRETMVREIQSRASLTQIIQRPFLDLYPKERASMPLEDVIAIMRRDLTIGTAGAPSTFVVKFSYPDPSKAQAVVREITARFMEQNFVDERARAKTAGPEVIAMLEHKMGANLEVLDPASSPVRPSGPDRVVLGTAGLAAGLLLGALVMSIRQRRNQPPPQLA